VWRLVAAFGFLDYQRHPKILKRRRVAALHIRNSSRFMERAMDIFEYCTDLGVRAKAAARQLATASGATKNQWLLLAAARLEGSTREVLAANAADIEHAPDFRLSAAQVDRLSLTDSRIKSAAEGLRQVAALPDPVGEVIDGATRPNGLEIRKVRVPLGVLLFIYESRPNVTVDAAGLAVKSGNAIILRGGKEALHSNTALYRILREALAEADLPTDAVQLVDVTDRAVVGELLKLRDYIDLAIPRGGESLIRRVAEEATMPVLKHYRGNCHVYIDRAADLDMAERIVINAKCQRPGVCNAMESLLVHRDVAAAVLPRLGKSLTERGVEIRGCPETRRLIPVAKPAMDEDYAAEYLELILSCKVIETIEEAISHVSRYGSQHTEAIVTNDLIAARRFTAAVDAAAVLVNASTRFHDGYEFGLGAEIGISTDKFHARGPCGLRELTTYKYVVQGCGQVRE
jgi:glutamate-5-semialdehyde dehydrogenase